jgi:hypothetical protein
MMAELEHSARHAIGNAGADVLLRKLFLRWMQMQPKLHVSCDARSRNRSIAGGCNTSPANPHTSRYRFIATITQAQAFRAQSLKLSRAVSNPPAPQLHFDAANAVAAEEDLLVWAGSTAARDALNM